ncbi:hypothetical protein [Methylobacterium sp. ARG-1]|uniref:hypothetical protein n=1 Tax=Methylobacterium sp. ARG-1 TaxID=1692501 RepID=UPI000681762B|nr:hypothetical protein [Methylobacterium sp. ARG-1]KNY21306.1 hypothetical protein AKJ13_17455 [Methylobacterium sp. ARG-1]
MFAVSPVAPSTVAVVTAQQVETPERVAAVMAGSLPVPAALDPRSTHALSAQTADAVLSLIQTSAPAPNFVAPFIHWEEPTQVGSGPVPVPPTLAGDSGTVVSETEAVAASSQGQGDRANAAGPSDSSAAALETKAIRRVEEAAKWDAYLYSIAHADSSLMSAISFYLMCNDTHYQDFKSEHPSMDIHWISVDNKKIVSVWPKITDQWFAPR